ncbi:hypothetical protein PoB_001339800 [Plakobranchus ocellatus]|uniref:Uncharacterized protein n=1 Tax=Plakobranchus ocellatus TaxID=259542 RepID=A0AAV3YWX6_9GAST|nr:hypothetical protein PoB_001339800 [Plakobranchus ocellatus]
MSPDLLKFPPSSRRLPCLVNTRLRGPYHRAWKKLFVKTSFSRTPSTPRRAHNLSAHLIQQSLFEQFQHFHTQHVPCKTSEAGVVVSSVVRAYAEYPIETKAGSFALPWTRAEAVDSTSPFKMPPFLLPSPL